MYIITTVAASSFAAQSDGRDCDMTEVVECRLLLMKQVCILPVRYGIRIPCVSYREERLYAHRPPCKTRHTVMYTQCVSHR